MENEIIKVSPDVCAYVDDKHTKMNMEITLPGVNKKDIDLKMHDDSMYLKAIRLDKNIEYVSALSFCCLVNPEKAHAKYENGLLKIQVPFKEVMEDEHKIQVN